MYNSQKLKNYMTKKSLDTGVNINELYQLFALEQLVKKIYRSPFKEYFIIKGGYLLSSIYGVKNRTTRDLDYTVHQLPLDKASMDQLIDIIHTKNNDDEYFKVQNKVSTRDDFEYNGYRLAISYHLEEMEIKIKVDITTGEDILPIIENKKLPLMFEKDFIEVPSYSKEQVLADKFYTTLAYGQVDDKNSRAKDLYDIYYLYENFNQSINYKQIFNGIELSKEQRSITIDPDNYLKIIQYLSNSEFQLRHWNKYRNKNPFAKNISFSQLFNSLEKFCQQVTMTD